MLLCLSGCARTERAFNQVLTDFGLRPRPEVEKPDMEGDIMSRLARITEKELARFNGSPVNTEIRFEKIPENPLGLGQFYKAVKVYEKAYPLDVTRKRAPQVQHAQALRKLGYSARVEYRYRIYRGKAFPSRDEARDSEADTRTDEGGREIYGYHFDEGGVWDGEPGRLERRIEAKNERSSGLNKGRTNRGESTDTVQRIEIGGTLRLRGESRDAVER